LSAIFTVVNALVLAIRIRAESHALKGARPAGSAGNLNG
jgi:isoprenylcysteine carboxyl methyltransferase (ICMT) family protein YpbQ